MIDNSNEYVLCAAIRRKYPRKCENPYSTENNDILNIELGYRHHDIYTRFGTGEESPLNMTPEAMGFYTSKGRFLQRHEAMEVAYHAGQVSEYRALDKSWLNCDCVRILDENGKPIETLNYPYEFNPLTSEDLY